MGDLSQLAGMMPGNLGSKLQGAQIDEKAIAHTEAIILSMTPEERRKSSDLRRQPKKRIAAGCGLDVVDVNRLLKQFEGNAADHQAGHRRTEARLRIRRSGTRPRPAQAEKEINRILDVITRTFIIKTSIYLLHFGGTING